MNIIVAHRTAISDLAIIPVATNNPVPIRSLLAGAEVFVVGVSAARSCPRAIMTMGRARKLGNVLDM